MSFVSRCFSCCFPKRNPSLEATLSRTPSTKHSALTLIPATDKQLIIIKSSTFYKNGNEGGVSIYKSADGTRTILKSLPKETPLLDIPEHNNLLTPTGYCHTSDHLILFYDYIDGKNLEELDPFKQTETKRLPGLSPDMKKQCLKEIASAVRALHEKNLVHGDIAPRNIMFDLKNKKFILIDTDHVKQDGTAIDPKDYDPRLFDNGEIPSTIQKKHDIVQLRKLFGDTFDTTATTLCAFNRLTVDNPELLKSDYADKLIAKTKKIEEEKKNKMVLASLKQHNFTSYFSSIVNEGRKDEIEAEFYEAIRECGINDEEDQFDIYQLFLELVNQKTEKSSKQLNLEISRSDGALGSKMQIMEDILLNMDDSDVIIEDLQKELNCKRRHSNMINRLSNDSAISVSPKPIRRSSSFQFVITDHLRSESLHDINIRSYEEYITSLNVIDENSSDISNIRQNNARASSSSSNYSIQTLMVSSHRQSATETILEIIAEKRRRDSSGSTRFLQISHV